MVLLRFVGLKNKQTKNPSLVLTEMVHYPHRAYFCHISDSVKNHKVLQKRPSSMISWPIFRPEVQIKLYILSWTE